MTCRWNWYSRTTRMPRRMVRGLVTHKRGEARWRIKCHLDQILRRWRMVGSWRRHSCLKYSSSNWIKLEVLTRRQMIIDCRSLLSHHHNKRDQTMQWSKKASLNMNEEVTSSVFSQVRITWATVTFSKKRDATTQFFSTTSTTGSTRISQSTPDHDYQQTSRYL